MDLPPSPLKLLQLLFLSWSSDNTKEIIDVINEMTKSQLEYVFRPDDNKYTFRDNGETFLIYFVSKGKHSIVKALLDKKVDPNQQSLSPFYYIYPLEAALQEADYPMIRMLIEYGADPNLCSIVSIFYLAYDEEMEKIILEYDFNTEKQYSKGRTSFHKAVFSNGSPRVIDHYLRLSDDFDTADEDGFTPLDFASGGGQVDMSARKFVLPILKKKLFLIQNSR